MHLKQKLSLTFENARTPKRFLFEVKNKSLFKKLWKKKRAKFWCNILDLA
jgi:hypothetical protein